MRTRFEDLEGGMWLDEALEAFVDGCNVPNKTLWITESWAQPLFARLRASVLGPISDEFAEALRQVVRRQHRLEDLVDWVELASPRPSFEDYARRCRDARDAAKADELREFVAGHASPPPARPGSQVGSDLASRWAPTLWLLEASLAGEFAPPWCPSCAVPGVKKPWTPAPGHQSALRGGHIVTCPMCQALLDVLAG
jgi:hypothetical protein